MIQWIFLGVLFLDQLSKFFILREMSFNQSIPLIPSVFHLTLVGNTGIAFGLFKGNSGVFVLAGLLILFWIYRSVWKNSRKDSWISFGLGLVLGGAVGNLIDRLRYGYVVDFLDFRVWPVFNVADLFISMGTACLFMVCFRK